MQIMKNRIRLNPHDPTKKLCLVIDGAKTVGIKFPEKVINIINAGSGLLSDDKDYSAVEGEAIALDRAIAGFQHWIYYCQEVELIRDCEGLGGLRV